MIGMPEATTPTPGPIRSLTVRQPWAAAIAHYGKNVENRSRISYYRGLLAIHAGVGVGTRWDYDQAVQAVQENAGVPVAEVDEGAQTRGAVVAVARLMDVCSASRRTGWYSPSLCDCGPWAQNTQHHLILADVRPLNDPVPCKGALGLWRLPDDVETAVRAQIGEVQHA